jgi:hypothetical protein
VPLTQGRTRTSRALVNANLVLRSAASSVLPSLPAAPGSRCQSLMPLQPGRRGTVLAATAGEAGENEGECMASFFNRTTELQSLAARLANAPKAVLVMTGPPSCGKSGARSWTWHFEGLRHGALTRARAPQRCLSS